MREQEITVGGIGVDAEHWSSGIVHLIPDSDTTERAACGTLLGAGCRYWLVASLDAVTCKRCQRSRASRRGPQQKGI